jgi:hypothetical protein
MPEHMQLVMTVTLLISLARVILNALETLSIRSEFSDGGSFSWNVRRLRYPWTAASFAAGTLDLLLSYPSYIWLNILQLGCVLTVLAAMFVWPSAVLPLLSIILGIELLSSLRNGAYGTEGSDLMQLIVFTSITLYYAVSDPLAKTAVIWFLALQAMLAYWTSGVVKLQSKPWRAGIAIPSVLSTKNYGAPMLYRFLIKNPRLTKVMSWGVILFEFSFPLVVLFGSKATLVLLLSGIFFHLMIAATMGLNGFVWGFIATYPSIYWFSQNLHWRLHRML